MELDPAGSTPSSVRTVSDVELASRLSFFLWSSIPDDELLAVAERGELSKPSVLESQVQRMLADQRSQALVKNFAGQWLFLRNVPAVQPDPAAFPDFDENLRQAMEKETTLWLESALRENRSVVDLLKTDYTYVNQRLAEHYGIKCIYGNEFRRVAVEDPNRRACLTSQHNVGDGLPESHGADDTREVGAGAAPGHAAAPAARQCSVLEGGRDAYEAVHAPTHDRARDLSLVRRLP
jgi:hypothetical protein